MNSAIYRLFMALGLTFTVYALVSCGPKRASQTGSSDSVLIAGGTSDSGGGNGVADKVYESYIKDPATLPAYQEFLKERIRNFSSNDRGEDEKGLNLVDFFKIKSWYFAPVELSKIQKDVLGISFLASETQQLARQTMHAVWIDSRIFDNPKRMSRKAQAELILHELVEAIYMVKWYKMSEVCKLAQPVSRDDVTESCAKHADILDSAFPPEPARKLNAEDYDNIRFVTFWIWQNASQKVDAKVFRDLLLSRGFDRRFFSDDLKRGGRDKELSHFKMTGREMFSALKGSELSRQMPTECMGTTLNQTRRCNIGVHESKVQLGEHQVLAYELTFEIEDEGPITFKVLNNEEIEMVPSEGLDSGVLYPVWLGEYKELVKVGDRVYNGIVFFEQGKNGESLSVHSILLRPSIVVSVEPTKNPICQIQTPKVEVMRDDLIWAKRAGSKPSPTVSLFLSEAPRGALCLPLNSGEVQK